MWGPRPTSTIRPAGASDAAISSATPAAPLASTHRSNPSTAGGLAGRGGDTFLPERLRVEDRVRTHRRRQRPTSLDDLEREDLGGAGGPGKGDGSEADRSGSDDADRRAGHEAAGTDEHGDVGDSSRLDEGTQLKDAIRRDPGREKRREGPAVASPRDHPLRVCPIEAEAELLDPRAVVWSAAPAGEALAAPRDLLRAHEVAGCEVPDGGADGIDDAGELVAGDDGRPDQARIEHVAGSVRFDEMKVRATDPAGTDPDHHIIRTWRWIGQRRDGDPRVAPDLVAAAGDAGRHVGRVERGGDLRSRVPVRLEL